MSAWSSVHLGGGVQATPTGTGNEMTGSRRLVDISDVMYARHSYSGAGILSTTTISIGYSIDNGATWLELLPPGAPIAAANYLYTSPWVDIRGLTGGINEFWVNAIQWGGNLLGLTANIGFVELQLR